MSFDLMQFEQGRTPDIVDETGAPAVTYIGFVNPGTVDPSEARFMIKRITSVAGITKTEYAGGNNLYNKVWNDRAILIYSYLK